MWAETTMRPTQDLAMSASRQEAITTAKWLKRTLASAPTPHRQARAVHAVLAAASGWSASERRQIDDFALWLNERPSDAALRAKCDEVLGALSARAG